MSVVQTLSQKGLIKPPPFVIGGSQYETIMGSFAYGVSSDSSDMDIYGWCIPPKDMIFPHLRGIIPGFGTQIQKFEQFEQHHVEEKDRRKVYDLNIYNIIKYFQLVMENNPNMVDSLFTHESCVLHATKLARHVRDNRKIFLHKGSWHKFKGYAYSQMHKMELKNPQEGSKRWESVQKYGFDVKFAYHVVRLLNEAEQILTEGDIDLMRNNEQLKAIRRGDWTMEQVKQHFFDNQKNIEDVYLKSTLRHKPVESEIKKLLMEVLEEHYGSIEGCVEIPGQEKDLLRQIQKLVANV